MTSKEIFARNLRALRLARGWSQEELAHRAGLDRTYISSLERQKYAPTLDALDKLAGALEATPSELISGPPQG
jgi:transcriptional regulator with XRE-family HTH domain